MVNKLLVLSIESSLKEIEARYREKYGAAVFGVKVEFGKSSISLEGKVLSERQKNEVFSAVRQKIFKNESGFDAKTVSRMISGLKNKIRVLSDPKEKLEIGWGVVKSDIADIWGIFPGKSAVDDKRRAIHGERSRATQAVKGDVVRILAAKGSYYLVQPQDLAVGWASKRQVSAVKNPALNKKWKIKKSAKAGEAIKAAHPAKLRNKFVSFLEKYLYTPYVWGGTTERGIDCSGLAQKFYLEFFGILLPRHSSDQSEFGSEVSLGKARFGDLVFLRQKEKKFPHVGIIIEENKNVKIKNQNFGDFLILNANRESTEVIIQNLSEILQNYNLISVKRLTK